MPNNPQNWLQILTFAVMAMGAGMLDYLYGVQQKRHAWAFLHFALHLCLAALTGLIVGTLVQELGYSNRAAFAATAVAGFMNVRLFEILECRLRSWRKKND